MDIVQAEDKMNAFWAWLNSLDKVREIVREAGDNPYTFAFYGIICFLVFGIVLVIIAYFASCSRARKSELRGFFRVSVSMNVSADSAISDTAMHYGTFLVGLYDAPEMTRFQLVPPRAAAERASGRHYDVSAFLHRFACAFENSGMGADQSCSVLKTLLDDDNFCLELGNISRTSARRGLRYHGPSEFRRNPEARDTISIFRAIPKHIAAAFATFPNPPRSIRIVLEYLGNSVD